MKVTIYGKTRCGFCEQAKSLCRMKGYEYEYLLLDADYTMEEFQEQFPDARTFPQICVGEHQSHVGGYAEFRDFVDAD
jgi:glutaredoxin